MAPNGLDTVGRLRISRSHKYKTTVQADSLNAEWKFFEKNFRCLRRGPDMKKPDKQN
jgi:hypothetical protein